MPLRARTSTPPVDTRSTEPETRQELGHVNHTDSQVEQDLDPPPAYSRSVPPSNLHITRDPSSEAMNTPDSSGLAIRDADESQPLLTDGTEQDQNTQHTEPNAETPLLAQSTSTQRHGTRSSWMKSRKMRSRWVRRFFCALLFLSIIASILVGFLVGYHGGVSVRQVFRQIANIFRPHGSVVRLRSTANPS